MDNNKVIVNTISALARAKGTNIKQLEKELAFGNGMIGKWAKAPKSPPIDKLSKIADYLSVPLEYLITGHSQNIIDTAPKKESPTDPETDGLSADQLLALEMIKQMDSDTLRKFIKAAKAMLED